MGWYTRINWKTGLGRMMGREKKNCEWCKDNEYRCQSDEIVGTCDFRTLPRSKEAILNRLKSEKEFVDSVKDKVKREKNKEEVQSLVGEVFDKVSGMAIMMNVLQNEFGMSESEVRKKIGLKEMKWAEKMKLIFKLKMMERSR